MATALGIVASTSASMGNSIDQTLGVVTAITEQTRNASKSARAANTIFSRLAQVVDENSDTGKALTQIYKDLDIALYDSTGQLRSTYDILADLASKWGSLDKNTQQYIAITSAGSNQLNNFLALMNNFDHAVDATATSLNSAGSAARENAAYMESLEAKTNALKAAFQDLANNVIESDLVKALLDLATSFLKVANSGIGQVVTQFTLLTGVLTGGIALFGKFGSALGSMFTGFGSLVKIIPELIAGTTTLTAGFGALSAAALPVAAAIAGVVAVGLLIYKVYKSASKPLSEYTEELNSSSEQLQTNKQRLEELNAIPWYDRTPEIEREISTLEAENEALQEQIDLLREERQEKARKTIEKTPVIYKERDVSASLDGYTGIGATEEEALQGLADLTGYTVEYLKQAGATIDKEIVTVSAKGDELADIFIASAQRVKAAMEQGTVDEDAQYIVNQLIASMQDAYIPALEFLEEQSERTGYAVEGYGEKQKLLLELYREYVQEAEEAEGATTALENVVSTYTQVLSDATQKHQNLSSILETVNQELDNDANWRLPVETLNEINNLLPDTVGQITNAIEAQQILQNAIIDTENTAAQAYANMMLSNGDFVAGVIQNSATLQAVLNQNYGIDFNNWKDLDSSKLTADTQLLNKLASMWSKYMGMTKQQIQAQVNSFKQFSSYLSENDRKELQAMESYLAYLNEAEKGMEELTFSPTSVGTGGDDKTVKTAGSAAKKTTDAYKEAFDEWLDYKDHQLAMDEITEEEYYTALKQKNEEYFAGKEEYLDEYRKYAEKVYEWEKKQAEEAAKAAKEAYEKYLDDIEDKINAVISYVTEYASRQIDALEKQIDAIDDEIDAVNDKYDAKIDALDEQNDALEKQIQLEQYLEALAKAKATQKLVFKDGQFQYQADVDAVSAAQSDIDAFNREQALEEQKAQIEQERQNELEQLENSKSALEQEKERWEEYKEGWSNLVTDYEYQQNELIAKQVLGIDLENSNWDTRLSNFDTFNQMYGQYQQMLLASQQDTADGEASIWNQRLADACDFMNQYAAIMGTGQTYSYTPVGGSGASKGTSKYNTSTSGTTESLFDPNDIVEPGTPWEFGDEAREGYAGKWSSSVDYGTEIANALERGATFEEINNLVNLRNQKIAELGLEDSVEATSSLWRKIRDSVGAHASGTFSARGGLSLVGEQGPELRVLSSGDGILPADITSNLWDWGSLSPTALLNSIASMNTARNNVFNIDNLSLPNVTDAQSLVTGLRQMAYQRAYGRA